MQKHVAVADKYYAFTREGEGERLLIVLNNGDSETITLDLNDTSIADAKTITPIFSASPAQLQGSLLRLQLAHNSLAIYQVQ